MSWHGYLCPCGDAENHDDFELTFGILIDTFVVRTILDPVLAALYGRWTWWPGGVPKPQEPLKLRLDSQRSGMDNIIHPILVMIITRREKGVYIPFDT
jgi:hypothetical protein